jgi:hypothetical protein
VAVWHNRGSDAMHSNWNPWGIGLNPKMSRTERGPVPSRHGWYCFGDPNVHEEPIPYKVIHPFKWLFAFCRLGTMILLT